jgi:hypothetical protein
VNPTGSFPVSRAGLFERILFLPDHLFDYIQLVLFPLNLNAEYSFAYPERFLEFSNLFSVIVVIAITVGSFFIYNRSRGIFFGIWWFMITLLPVSNLIEIHNPIAERYLYLPLVGFCIIISIFINDDTGTIGFGSIKKYRSAEIFYFDRSSYFLFIG